MVTIAGGWTTADLESLPDTLDDTRYEIIQGELFVAHQPSFDHQYTCAQLTIVLGNWTRASGLGTVLGAPGVIFADDENVAPDVVWISHTRRAAALGADGKLHLTPELMIEVLSPGDNNERRDREAKLKLYDRRGVAEYWLVEPLLHHVEVYRRDAGQLRLASTLFEADLLASPLLPGFSVPLAELFYTSDH